MNITQMIDWITITITYDTGYFSVPADMLAARKLARYIWIKLNGAIEEPELAPGPRMPGYEYAFKAENGMVLNMSTRDAQGVAVVLTGRVIPEVDLAVLDSAVCTFGGSYSRVDYALDVHDQPQLWASLCMAARTYTRTRKMKSIVTKDGDDVIMSRVGSRNSEFFVRFYDKAREQKLPDAHWLRLECEMKLKKNRRAKLTLRDFVVFGQGRLHAIVAASGDELLNPVLNALEHGEPPPATIRPRTDREKWLHSTVLPCVATLAREDDQAYRTFVQAVLDAGMDEDEPED